MPAMQNITTNLPQIDEHQQHFLDENISLGELKTALDGLVDHKAPDFDGLPAEFYKTFWDMLGPALLSVFLYSLQEGLLPLSCRHVVVCLIPKKRDLQLMHTWRTISLLCVDYTIFAKTLANRVKSVLSTVIH